MAISPIPTPDVILPNPEGTTGSNYNYVIPDDNLATLSTNAKSSLLAVSNLGSSVTSTINSSIDLIRSFENFQTYLLDHTLLDNLANNTATSNYTFTNTTGVFVKVIVILGSITPSGSPTVCLRKGSDIYQVTIPSGTDQKRIEFNNIPASFVSSFQVENRTGTSFPSYGNSILVVNL